jgi:hypothetical protein
LSGVAAASPEDVWAIGGDFLEHWNGTRWHRVPVGADGYLTAITALAADDAWAVGITRRSALIEHWDGRVWTPLPLSRSASTSGQLLGIGASRYLEAVSASADDDVWAVGHDRAAQIAAGKFRTLGVVLHWDGRVWKQVATRIGVLRDVTPAGVVAISAKDVWVIANGVLSAYGVALHWDGRRWRTFRLRGPVSADEGGSLSLNSVTAVTPRDIRVVGAERAPGEGADEYYWGVIFRWNGHTWIRRIPENHGPWKYESYDPSYKSYDAIVARTPTEVWIAANDADGFSQQAGADQGAAS